MSEKHEVLCAVLDELIEQGLRFPDAMHCFAKRRTEDEVALVKKAQEEFHADGELEIDDNAYVSLPETDESQEPHKGAYVLGWVWVDK